MQNLRQYIQPTIYTAIALLYLCLGDVFDNNQTYTTPLHGLYLALTLGYVVLCFTQCRMNKVMRATAVLYFLHLGYGLFFNIVGFGWMVRVVDSAVFVSTYFNSMSAIFVYYYFAERGMIDRRWITYSILVFAVAVFYQHQFYLIRMDRMYVKSADEMASNSGYYFLALLPAAAFLKQKPILMYALIAYLTLMMLTCAKRGAILIAALVDAYLIYQTMKTSRHKFLILILSSCILVGLAFYVLDIFLNNDLFASRVDETLSGDTSERVEIYIQIFYCFFFNNTLIGFLIGNGPYAPSRLLGTMAHNDWLEIALSMGVLGIIIYIRYWRAQIRAWRDARRTGVDNQVILAMALFIFINLIKTLFSMSLDNLMIYTTSIMGYCFSKCNNNETT